MAGRNNWTREEVLLAFNLYCKIPFGKINQNHKKVIALSELIGRTPGAVSLKLGNIASFDPVHQQRGVKGLRNSSKLDKKIWDEFSENCEGLSFESEKLLAEYKKETIEESAKIETDDLPIEGKERERSVKVRVNQSFFRQSILSAFGFKCCVTGISVPELLIASHIKPWSKDKKNRMNPKNGLCLNALHDKAFDRGFITFSNDFKMIVSDHIKKTMESEIVDKYFYSYQGKQIKLPERFLPEVEFLEYHKVNIFESFNMDKKTNGYDPSNKSIY